MNDKKSRSADGGVPSSRTLGTARASFIASATRGTCARWAGHDKLIVVIGGFNWPDPPSQRFLFLIVLIFNSNSTDHFAFTNDGFICIREGTNRSDT